jgi:hypothetical protein
MTACDPGVARLKRRIAMLDPGFFEEIEQTEVPFGERSIRVPVFYYDTMRLDALFLASRERLEALMPSPRMHPLRVTPWQGIVAISAMEFRDSDIGPYNEVSISVPFTMDDPSPLFTGILRKGAKEPNLYIHQLPVTTEIARAAGVDFAGYPKFIGKIGFEKQGEWVSCHLSEDTQPILAFAGRRLETQKAPRSRVNLFTVRNGRILRSIKVTSERLHARSKDRSNVKLELGDHPIAEELRGLGMGRLMVYQYTPQSQTILSPALESFVV